MAQKGRMIVSENDRQFVGELYEQYGKKLWKAVYYIVKNESDASDLVQDLFAQMIDNIDLLKNARVPEAYLIISLKHLAFDKLKKRIPTLNYEDYLDHCVGGTLEFTSDTLEDMVIRSETGAIIRNHFSELSRIQREYLVLKYYMELDNREIGEKLHITQGYARVLDQRVKETLKAVLQKEGYQSNDAR